MPVEQAIVRALLDRVDTFDHSPALDVSYPRVPFTPPTDANWLRATFLPGDTFAEGISYSAHNRHVGVLQLDVFAKADDSLPSLMAIASALVLHFKRGTSLTNGGLTVKILESPSILPLQSDAGGSFLPVRVNWTCFAPPPSP